MLLEAAPRLTAPPVPARTIGLLNLMPPRAMAAAERQFATALGPGARLRAFAPAATAAAHGAEPIAALWDAELDGLIVTGAEPQAAAIAGEPLLPLIAGVADWAAAHAPAVIWSCFAAHAALYHLSGIPRRRLATKLSGVYACARAAGAEALPHALGRWRWVTPHSRHNTVDAADLAAAGYAIVSHGSRIGVDIAARTVGGSRFLFFQGHPEYAPATLTLEYLRDQARHARGELPAPPALPDLRDGQDWQPAARAIFSSWLGTLPRAALAPSVHRLAS